MANKKKKFNSLGIDLASQPGKTAACKIKWEDGMITDIDPPDRPCTDEDLDRMIDECGADRIHAIGIDAPFGWPKPFRTAVANWGHQHWNNQLRDELRFRATDKFVHNQTGRCLWPLSVSTDRISIPAMRAMALLLRHGVTDKSGDGKFYEVYPAGSLKVWGLPHEGYKKGTDAAGLRVEIVNLLQQSFFPGIDPLPAFHESDHALDALVASISAGMAKLGRTRLPLSPDDQNLARTEGWIHLPNVE